MSLRWHMCPLGPCDWVLCYHLFCDCAQPWLQLLRTPQKQSGGVGRLFSGVGVPSKYILWEQDWRRRDLCVRVDNADGVDDDDGVKVIDSPWKWCCRMLTIHRCVCIWVQASSASSTFAYILGVQMGSARIMCTKYIFGHIAEYIPDLSHNETPGLVHVWSECEYMFHHLANICSDILQTVSCVPPSPCSCQSLDSRMMHCIPWSICTCASIWW